MNIIFSYLHQEINTVRQLQSINQILSIPKDSPLFTDDASEALEDLMSNWFLERRSGIKVTGTVAIRFSRREPLVIIRSGHNFRAENGEIFLASSDNTFESSSNQNDYRQISVGPQTLYEVLVSVESEGEGSAFLVRLPFSRSNAGGDCAA